MIVVGVNEDKYSSDINIVFSDAPSVHDLLRGRLLVVSSVHISCLGCYFFVWKAAPALVIGDNLLYLHVT